jgi:hypothetical protein
MTEPPNEPGNEGSCSKPDKAPTESAPNKTVREKYLEMIARNPKWRDTTEPGRGFVIGGVKPSSQMNETGIPDDKVENDLDLPEDATSRYSPGFLQTGRAEEEVNDMTQNMKDTNEPNSPAPSSETTIRAQTASSAMTLDELMQKLSADPRCRIVKPSGKAFVIGGAKASTTKLDSD